MAPLLTVQEVAEQLQVSTATVYRLCDRGELAHVRISNAIRIADIASLYGVECMIGCMIESSVSVAAAVHLAVAKSDVITKVDLDGPSLCTFDPVEGGVLFNEAEISISDAPGLGIRSIRGLEMLPD